MRSFPPTTDEYPHLVVWVEIDDPDPESLTKSGLYNTVMDEIPGLWIHAIDQTPL